MTDDSCHIPEWAALLGESVPEEACDRRQFDFRPRDLA